MTPRAARSARCVSIAAIALVLVATTACSGSSSPAATRTASGRDLHTPTAVRPTVTPASATVIAVQPGSPPVPGPPIAHASAGGASIELTAETYFWNGTQVDQVHLVTNPSALAVSPGGQVSIANPAPGKTLVEAGVATIAATDTPRALSDGSDRVEWPYGPTYRAEGTIGGDGAFAFAAPQAPGRYVVSIFLRFADETQVYYAGLIAVR